MSIVIDDITYDIPVIGVKRTAEFLDKYAERTEDGVLHRELIGVYYNYVLTFGRTNNTTEYASFWDKLTEPVEFHDVIVPDEDGAPLEFTAYFAGVSDELRKDTDAKTFWKNLTVTFIAQEPIRTP